ncbi:hypothetical protein TIFTF001_044613 [Ficus carica]|uniref:Uncharacterized protein n=1 Tax=Ficus carica TaxID=3494 RepID=A0AA87ZH47_FICCA|nr:hypothetical protein TIFTF001_044613 [Ficus carica]
MSSPSLIGHYISSLACHHCPSLAMGSAAKPPSCDLEVAPLCVAILPPLPDLPQHRKILRTWAFT